MSLNDSNLSVHSPYYNDYAHALEQNHQAILFNPSYPIQSRELTQLQYLLQSQVDRLGSHFFKNGSLVLGSVAHTDVQVVPVVDGSDISSYIGKKITTKNIDTDLLTSKTFLVNYQEVVSIDGTEYPFIFVTNISEDLTVPTTPVSGYDMTTWQTQRLNPTEGFIVYGDNQTFENTCADAGTLWALIGASNDQFNEDYRALLVTLDNSVFFHDGYFVATGPQKILSKTLSQTDAAGTFSLNDQTVKVGLNVDKKIETIDQDSTLGDPAGGSNNANAPGADRLVIDLIGTSVEWDGSTDENDVDFIEILRLVAGEIIFVKVGSDYSEIMKILAERTYDAHGSFVVDPYAIKFDCDLEDAEKFKLIIEPGTSYVKGYKHQTIGNTIMSLDRARDTKGISEGLINGENGSYVYAVCPTAIPDFNAYESVQLWSETSQIGTALLKDIVFVDGRYLAYLVDIQVYGGNTFGSVQKIKTTGGDEILDIDPSSGMDSNEKTLLFGSEKDVCVFSMSDFPVAPDTITEFSYKFRQVYQSVSSNSSGEVTLTVPNSVTDKFQLRGASGTTWASFETMIHFLAINTTTGLAETISISNIVDASGGNWTDVVLSGLTPDETFDFAQTIERIQQPATLLNRKKSLHLNVLLETSGNVTDGNDVYTLSVGAANLNIPDVIRIRKVERFSNGEDITEYFNLDNGSRDNYYDFSKLTFIPKNGKTQQDVVPESKIKVYADFFAWDDDVLDVTVPFTVDSYDFSAANTTLAAMADDDKHDFEKSSCFADIGYTYSDIPSYQSSSNGFNYELRSSVDFRRRRNPRYDYIESGGVWSWVDNGAGLPTFEDGTIPVSAGVNSTITASFETYVPRVDKLVIRGDGRNFSVLKGIPDFIPVPIDDPRDDLVLWEIFVPAYTDNSVSQTVIGNYRFNERYTFADLHDLESRVQRLEDQVSLNLLETKIKDQTFLDSNGLPLLKNGIFADDFKAFNLADEQNEFFQASLDIENGEMRPSTYIFNLALNNIEDNDGGDQDGENFAVYDNRFIMIAPTGSETFVNQRQASSAINVNPYNVFVWEGSMSLSPSVDSWADFEGKVVTVDTAAEFDFNHNFDSWSEKLLGKKVEGYNYSGIDSNSGILWNDIYNYTDVKTSTKKSWYGKKKTTTTVTRASGGDGIRQEASVMAYIRSREVQVNVKGLKPNTTHYVFFDKDYQGVSAVTTGAGTLTTSFVIPANTYFIGTHQISVFDNEEGKIGNETSWSSAEYFALGIMNSTTGYIIPEKKEVSKTSSSSWSLGGLVTSLQEITTGTVLSPLGGSDRTAWAVPGTSVAENLICWKDPIAQSFLVDSAVSPNGIVLKSIDVWFQTIDPALPVTMEIRPSVNGFPSATSVVPLGTKVLVPGADTIRVAENAEESFKTTFEFDVPVSLVPGEYHIVLRSNSDEYRVWTSVVGEVDVNGNKITSQPYDGVFFTSANSSTWTADQNRDLTMRINRYDYSPQVGQGSKNGTVIFVNEQTNEGTKLFDAMYIKANTLTHGNSQSFIKWEYQTTSITNGLSSLIPAPMNETFAFGERMKVDTSVSIQDQVLTNQIGVRATMATADKYVSPIMDMEQMGLTCVANIVNNNSDTEEQTRPDENRSAAARYITKQITMKDGLEFEDLRVSMSVNLQKNSSIKVFYRALGVEDTTTAFKDREWSEMELEQGSSFVQNNDPDTFTDYTFVPPLFNEFGERSIRYDGSGDIKTFAVKVVLLQANTATPPRVKNFRGVALL